MKKVKKILKEHLCCADIIVCLLLSLIIPASNYFITGQHPSFNLFYIFQILLTFLLTMLCTILARHLFKYLANKKAKSNKFSKYVDRVFNSKHRFLWLTLIIFLFWVPALIMLFPGTMINDSWGQLNQVINSTNGEWGIDAHHPVFDTMIMSAIIIPIATIFNNWHFGFFVYVIIQAVCTSLVFSYSISYMKDKFKQTNLVSLIFLLIYCLYPIFVASVQTISKDALSAWIYLLFIIYIIDIIRTKNFSLKSKRFLILFVLICLLCILTKKVETYIVLITLISILIFQKENRKFLLIPIGITTIVAFLILPTLREKLDIEKSGPQEMFSLPFQQTALYVTEHQDEIPESEAKVLDKVLDYNDLASNYNPTNADMVKGFSPKGDDKDYLSYLKVWAKQGLKHPDTYISATSAQLSGWFSFSMYHPVTNMKHHTQLDTNLIPESASERNGFFSSTANLFDSIYKFIYSVPILGVFLTFAFFATLLPFFIICTLIKNRKTSPAKYILLCIPLLLSLILGCYLAPVSVHLEGMRYLYPITYTAPTLIMLVISLYKKSSNTK